MRIINKLLIMSFCKNYPSIIWDLNNTIQKSFFYGMNYWMYMYYEQISHTSIRNLYCWILSGNYEIQNRLIEFLKASGKVGWSSDAIARVNNFITSKSGNTFDKMSMKKHIFILKTDINLPFVSNSNVQ